MSADDIAKDIAERIESGEYASGDQLPTIKALARWYSVHPSTISRAMIALRARQLIVGAPGRGTFVA